MQNYSAMRYSIITTKNLHINGVTPFINQNIFIFYIFQVNLLSSYIWMNESCNNSTPWGTQKNSNLYFVLKEFHSWQPSYDWVGSKQNYAHFILQIFDLNGNSSIILGNTGWDLHPSIQRGWNQTQPTETSLQYIKNNTTYYNPPNAALCNN